MTEDAPSELRSVDARPLLVVAAGVTALLLALNLGLMLLGDRESEAGVWLTAFSVNRELSVPTMWNAALFLYASAACLLVAAVGDRRRRGWVLAAVILAVMAFDEVLSVHERLRGIGGRVNALLPFALPTYSWLLPGLLVAAVLVVAAMIWVRRLPRDVRRWILAGVGIFFAGAIGAEGASGWIDQRRGVGTAYVLATTLEEGLEMTGCIVLAGGALRMLRSGELAGRRVLTGRDGA